MRVDRGAKVNRGVMGRRGPPIHFLKYRVTIHKGILVLLRYNPRHGSTHPGRLRVFSGAALPHSLFSLVQRTSGPCRGPGATTTPTDTRSEGAARWRPTHDWRTGRAVA